MDLDTSNGLGVWICLQVAAFPVLYDSLALVTSAERGRQSGAFVLQHLCLYVCRCINVRVYCRQALSQIPLIINVLLIYEENKV